MSSLVRYPVPQPEPEGVVEPSRLFINLGPIGYRITPFAGTANIQHTPNHHAFYVARLGQWFCIVQDDSGSDWFLWVWDGTFPVPGTTGGWTKAKDNLDADVQIDGTDSSHIDLYWDATNEQLHVRIGKAGALYKQYDLRGAPDDDWQLITNEALGSLTEAESKSGSICVAEDGIPWVAYMSSDQLTTIERAGGTWNTPLSIEASASTTGITRVALRRYTAAGAAGLMAVYSYNDGGTERLKAARRLDTDLTTASWTIETAVSEDIDDHVDAATVLLGSDTTSTVCVAYKDGTASGNVRVIRRDSAGSWSTPITIRNDTTRPKVVLDEDGENFHVYYPNDSTSGDVTEILTRSAPIASMETLSNWSGESIVMRDQPSLFGTNLSVSAHNVGGTSKSMVLSKSDGFFWYNLVNIESVEVAPTGTGVLTLLGATMSAQGAEEFIATGTLSLLQATIAAQGLMQPSGTGALALLGPTVIAQGLQKFVGTGAFSLLGPTIAAQAVMQPSGTGALTLLGPTIAATAAVAEFVATGALSLLGPTISAVAVMQPSGTSVLSLLGPTISAQGLQKFEGSGTLTLLGPTVAAQAVMQPGGTGTIVLLGPTLTAQGELPIEGSSALLLLGPTIVSQGVMEPDGAGALSLLGVILSASGSLPTVEEGGIVRVLTRDLCVVLVRDIIRS